MTDEQLYDRIGHTTISLGNLKADIYAILANFSTLSNLLLGLAISISILLNNPLDTILSGRMISLAACFDAIDGRLARRSNTKPKLGAQFDTAADQISFGAAPALMIMSVLVDLNFWAGIGIGIIYFFTASFRLSRFMMEPTSGYFNGMPSPVSGIFIVAWYILPDINLPLFAASSVFISLLMISSLPYTGMKNTRSLAQKFYFVFTVSMLLLLIFAPSSWMEILGKVWIVYIYYFGILGPKHARHNMRIDEQLKQQ